MTKDFAELEVILRSNYTKQDIEEAKHNFLGYFATLREIKERLNSKTKLWLTVSF